MTEETLKFGMRGDVAARASSHASVITLARVLASHSIILRCSLTLSGCNYSLDVIVPFHNESIAQDLVGRSMRVAHSSTPSLPGKTCHVGRQLSKCTVLLAGGKCPLRVVILSALLGLCYYLRRTVHFDGSYVLS